MYCIKVFSLRTSEQKQLYNFDCLTSLIMNFPNSEKIQNLNQSLIQSLNSILIMFWFLFSGQFVLACLNCEKKII